MIYRVPARIRKNGQHRQSMWELGVARSVNARATAVMAEATVTNSSSIPAVVEEALAVVPVEPVPMNAVLARQRAPPASSQTRKHKSALNLYHARCCQRDAGCGYGRKTSKAYWAKALLTLISY